MAALLETATGLKGQLKPLDPPHTEENFKVFFADPVVAVYFGDAYINQYGYLYTTSVNNMVGLRLIDAGNGNYSVNIAWRTYTESLYNCPLYEHQGLGYEDWYSYYGQPYGGSWDIVLQVCVPTGAG